MADDSLAIIDKQLSSSKERERSSVEKDGQLRFKRVE